MDPSNGQSGLVDLMRAARLRVQERGTTGAADEYADMLELLRSQPEIDLDGLGQLVAEIEQSGGIMPPQPPTRRGRIGAALIRVQCRALWWLVRAVSRRDNAWRAVYDMLTTLVEQQTKERFRREQSFKALEARIAALEEALRTSRSEGSRQ